MKLQRILSEDSACIDVSKLLVIDSLKGYFGSKDGLMPFVKRTVHYAKSSGRTSVTVIGDRGSFFFYGKIDALIGWEMELPRRFEIDPKGFCLYHMQDFKTQK